MRFLVVEDTGDLSHAIATRLGAAGHIVEIAETLSDARHFLSAGVFDMIILDVNLPDGSGFDLLGDIRSGNRTEPVIVLTARLAVDDKIGALDLGADDYMVKPFRLGELEARIRAVMRRAHLEGESTIDIGNLSYRPSSHEVRVNDVIIALTRSEIRLFEIFAMNLGRVIEKSKLIDRLYQLDNDVSPNAVELTLSRLRKKLSDADLDIKTLRGLGYQAVKKPS